MNRFRMLITLSILLLTGFQSLRADISIVDFSTIRRGMVIQQRVLDDKGKFCALIRVKTDIKDIMVDATQVRKEKSASPDQTLYLLEPQCADHPDEVWVYLSSATKRIRLFHPVYGGMKDESAGVRYGYYYLPDDLSPELVYTMEIECKESDTSTSLNAATTMSHTLVDAHFSCDDDATKLYLDGNRVIAGKKYLVPTGQHSFKASRLFHNTEKQRFEAIAKQPIDLSASLSRIPANVFGGIELGKPTSYSDLAYGVRAGILCRWGLYFSFLTTLGNATDGDAVDISRLPFESIPPYSDPHCQYQHWNVGLIYNCYSALHIYAGVGQATRSVNWLGLDGKRHEMVADHFSGTSWEAGLLCNWKKFYLSAGADCVDGSYGGRVGAGIYLNILK